MGKEFIVNNGVRQGCVVALLLFNVFLDFVVRQALADMSKDAIVLVGYHGDGILLFEQRAKGDLICMKFLCCYMQMTRCCFPRSWRT
jgi:hypothetical protein